jgi:hypothetical protein
MSIIDEVITGINPAKEITNLWVENTYLRLIFNEMIHHLTNKAKIDFSHFITSNIVEECRKQAIEEVSKKFPKISLEYKSSASEASQEEVQQCNPPPL